MKIPISPKPMETLLATHRKKLLRILPAAGPLPGGRYLHWDQLRHREPPVGLDHEEWWLGIKLSRVGQYRLLPMADQTGQPVKYMLPDTVLETLHYIDAHTGTGKDIYGDVVTAETRDRFIFNSLVEEAITSSQLEGATTSSAEARDMIRYGREPRDRSQRMILNNYLAMRQIRDVRAEAMSLPLLLNLHEVVTIDTLDDPEDAGRIQVAGEERVKVRDRATGQVLYSPPPADLLPERLGNFVRFANGESDNQFTHPLIRAIALHYWIGYDHPFVDGNGRTARAIFYWCMLHNGYPLFEFLPISSLLVKAPAKYSLAYLFAETDDNDLTYFILYQLDIVRRAIEHLKDYLEVKAAQVRRVTDLLKDRQELNHRQVALLSHAIRHPGTDYTIHSHQTSHSVAYATARQDLHHLAELRLLDQRTSGRVQIFTAPVDLEPRLLALP